MASTALRHSRALNVGTFHAPTERVVATQVARKVVQLVFGRLDARTADLRGHRRRCCAASSRATTRSSRPAPTRSPAPERADDAPVRIAFVEQEERGALRLFLRALRRLDPGAALGAPSCTPSAGRRRRRRCAPTCASACASSTTPTTALAGADVLVAASDGVAPAPGLHRARARRPAPSRSPRAWPVYEEVLGDGEAGLLFEPNDLETLAAQLGRLVADGDLRERLRAAARPRPWSAVADELEALYAHARGAPPRRPRQRRDRARGCRAGRMIDVDLHMHTDHSHDCATPVEVLLATARDQGLGAIAVTDHNEVSGRARGRRPRRPTTA